MARSGSKWAVKRDEGAIVVVLVVVLLVAAAVVTGGAWALWRMRAPERASVLRPTGGPEVVIMDFSEPFSLDPLPPGWHHRTFLTRAPAQFSFAEQAGISALRVATEDSASMLNRFTDIPLADYPLLVWRWYVEQPIESATDERTRAGDDHPARLFLRMEDGDGSARAMEIIWGNKLLERGDFKYIDSFPHYVANGGDANVGVWHEERVDLQALVARLWPEFSGARVVDVALFCDSDETDTASVAYFADIRMQRPR